jgi:hypothetical protein
MTLGTEPEPEPRVSGLGDGESPSITARRAPFIVRRVTGSPEDPLSLDQLTSAWAIVCCPQATTRLGRGPGRSLRCGRESPGQDLAGNGAC